MVIGVPKQLDITKVKDEVSTFAAGYKLSEQEKTELAFIMNTFCKYYNKMSDSSQMFEQETIIDSFEGVLESIVDTYNGTGLQTRANLFWKQLPCIMQMIKDSGESKAVKELSNKKKATNTAKPDKPKPAKPSKTTSSSSYSSNSYSSYSRPSFDSCGGSYRSSGGGCGGNSSSGGSCGGSYSSGGHC